MSKIDYLEYQMLGTGKLIQKLKMELMLAEIYF